jgi:poly(A) polymerase
MEDLKIAINPSAMRLLTSINRLIGDIDVKAYVVGGFVRDSLLGRATHDIDIATDTDAREIASKVASLLGGHFVLLDDENQTGRVILFDSRTPGQDRWQIDFTTLKGTIEEDLPQRDFTIDAIAIELETIVAEGVIRPSQLIDPCDGRDDLRRGIVRATGELGFSSDPARLLRAFRIAGEFDFTIESKTESLIRRDAALISIVAGERTREELLRIMALPQAGKMLAYMDDLGLLTAIIPELAEAKGVDQPTTHVWDVFHHSINTVVALEAVLREGTWPYAGENALKAVPWSSELRQNLDGEVSSGSTRRTILKVAALLHDIAKPQTKTVDETGRARFLGHPQEGAATTASILERLRFSAKEIKLTEILVKNHLRPTQMSHEEMPTRRAIYRYFRDTGDAGIDILFLSLADHLATRGETLIPAEWENHVSLVNYILTKHSEEETIIAPHRVFDGNDLINLFSLKPGPEFKEILEALKEAQASMEVTNREEAINYVKKLLAARQ